MIFLLLALAAALYLAERYSLAHAFDRLSVQVQTDRAVVEPDEVFDWTMIMENGKRMMVPYLYVREQIPGELLSAETKRPFETDRRGRMISVFYLAGRQKAQFHRTAMFGQRGVYRFQDVSMEAGDFLGLDTVTKSCQVWQEMVVKPRPADDGKLSELLGGFLGEHVIRKSLMEDPISTVEFREYTGREPFRSISWTQSAKMDRLMVKQYESTTDYSCTVLLNADWYRESGSAGESCKWHTAEAQSLADAGIHHSDEELMEYSISIVRSVCEELERRHITYDFRTNGRIIGTMGDWSQIGDGLGRGHLETILEALGRMDGERRQSCYTFLEKEIRMARRGKSVILATPGHHDFLAEAVSRLEQMSGRQVLLLSAERLVE